MPRIRKKDADQKRKLLNWFKSKEGQKSLKNVQEDAMVDPYGRPINVMLPEAEVSTLGNKDRDLSRDVLLGLREAAGMAPILGEGLDAAELSNIVKTGKDFYGDEADPKMYAGMTTAGLLVPNLIEKPVKGALKLVKKGVQKLRGSGSKALKKTGVKSYSSKPFLDMEGLADNEISTFKKMDKDDFVGQAKIDMSLHDMAQSSSSWNSAEKKFLEDDKALKQGFINLIENGGGSKEEIQSVIEGITKDQDIHVRYMNDYLIKNPDLASKAGGPAWHRNWIKVYDGWLDELKRMSSKSVDYAQGGKFKVKKKAQEGMKVKKSNGDPPKGYKRDADGYLTPVDFNEFHEMPSDSLNVDAIKKGISMAESIGGVLMMNPTSTATGMYGQRYSEIKDLPFMKGISREEFAKDLPLQEKVFEMRMDEGIGGPSLRRNAMELTEEYAPQLGDDWNFSLDDVAFLSNFLGRQRTREYFASRRDGTKFSVPGTNKTVDEYLKIARGAAYKD